MENLIKVLKLIKVKKVAKYLEWIIVYQSNRGVPYHKAQRVGILTIEHPCDGRKVDIFIILPEDTYFGGQPFKNVINRVEILRVRREYK